MRSGWLRRKTPCRPWTHEAPVIVSRFFNEQAASMGNGHSLESEADKILQGRFKFFNNQILQCGLPPDWFSNPLDETVADDNALQQHWSEISDFSHGDIKCIWELSRFGWVFPLLRSYQATKKEIYADTFWQLVEDWADRNPPNRGVHWKCGQEVAIRMFALASGYFSLGHVVSEQKALVAEIIFESAKRIEANIGYALSQKNNHGISEAAGLFTAGILLGSQNWVEKGSSLLEDQISTLVSSDGSFSQHSANYHRLMLHACLWAVQLGRANGFEFSIAFIERIRKAGEWLTSLYDTSTGHMPNLGSNDGALILPYSACDYLDYQPTIQATGAVVDNQRWLPVGEWDDLALWLVPDLGNKQETHAVGGCQVIARKHTKERDTPTSLKVLEEGGYAILSNHSSNLIFRCPKRFQFRPAQCDLLHIDLWYNGINLLRDAGTYSYNCPSPWQNYFKSNAAHNTIQFDDHDQMPQISRFLYGKWPQLDVRHGAEGEKPYIEAGFTDWNGCFHKRSITSTSSGFNVVDNIKGNFTTAVLRWRLSPELDWKLDGNICTSDRVSLSITSSAGKKSNLTVGWESLHYMEKTPVPVLETTVGPDCRELTTTISFS
ncbi:conserved uncharacterized protein, related to heparinase II/III [Desulfosarcina variabilis str. Montpellier]